MLNLLVNAIDGGGERHVVTLTSEFDAAEQMARLRCRTNGVGIAEKEQEQIFLPFFSTKGQRGTGGLGLAVRRRSRSMAGRWSWNEGGSGDDVQVCGCR